jgi:hypothetical protein
MVIELDGGSCLAARFGPAPLARQVAGLLDGLLYDLAPHAVAHCGDHAGLGQPPARVLTDDKTDVHLGTLATWGLARGIQTGCHSACTLHPQAVTVLQDLTVQANAWRPSAVS